MKFELVMCQIEWHASIQYANEDPHFSARAPKRLGEFGTQEDAEKALAGSGLLKEKNWVGNYRWGTIDKVFVPIVKKG